MRLSKLVQHYQEHHSYGLAPATVQQLTVSVAAWERFCGRGLGTNDLSSPLLNRYLDWLQANRAVGTVRSRRGNLLLLWRHARQCGLVAAGPGDIRRLRPCRSLPRAWTVDEVRRLIVAAAETPGRFRHSPLRCGHWTESLFRAGYDTALRLGDLLSIEYDWIPPSGSFIIRQAKTGDEHRVRLRDTTLKSIWQTMEDQPRRLIWPQWGRREAIFRHIHQVICRAGVTRGTFKWFRRTAITQVERIQPGAGTVLAGHRSRAVTERYYIDRSQLGDVPLPPL